MCSSQVDDKSKLQLRVVRKQFEATGIYSFELRSPDNNLLPEFSAGAHIDIELPGGIIRQYSLCNKPTERDRYKIAVLREETSRGGSQALHDVIQEGQLLQASPPKNHFPLAIDAQRSLLLAAGIGITPILSMAEELMESGAKFELHYCAKTPDHAAFLKYIRDSLYASQSYFYFSKDKSSQSLDLNKLLSKPEAGCHLYICGPKRFIDAALEIARQMGWPDKQLHYELFGAQIVHSKDDASFEVELASSGRIIKIPEDQTVTQALAAAGVDIMVSCEQGVCGTCLTGIVSGIPDHKDNYLTPEEQASNKLFTPCCSRAKTSRLVLDI